MEIIVSKKRVEAAQNWLLQSIDVCEGRGSSAFYHPVKGWAPAYPETTGYLIPTLLQTAFRGNKEKIHPYLISCADWLCSIQNKNGSFPGGVGGKLPPNVFDTGQVIIGLTAAYEYAKFDRYLEAVHRAVTHLLSILEPEGSWKKECYVEHYVPSYYTRVIWAVLQANEVLRLPGLREKMIRALDFYAAKVNKNFTVQNWAFAPGEIAFTHTIAYTIRGFLESGLILKADRYIEIAEKISLEIINQLLIKGEFAGSYDEKWKGDYHYICVPGHFQMAFIFNKLFDLKKDPIYREWAEELFLKAQNTQYTLSIKGMNGGLPGSSPIWGKYQRWRFPNWSVKFYLDAAYSF